MSERSDFYVYSLHAPDTGLEHPRYVGKGWGRRVIAHRTKRTKRVSEWIAEVGEPFFDLIAANLSEAEAYALEIELIAKYGREGINPGGTLVNVSTGGAGAPGVKKSPENRAAIAELNRGRKHTAAAIARMRDAQSNRSPEIRANMSAAQKGHATSDATRAAVSAALKGKPKSSDHRAALAAASRGKAKSPEHVEKMRANAKAQWAAKSPDEREAHMASLRNAQTPDSIAKTAAANRGRKRSPDAIERTAAAHRGMKRSIETCAKLAAATKAHYAAKRASITEQRAA